jgi:uracil-DNA glycosylase
LEELNLLKKVQVIVPLGQIAFSQTLKSLRLKGYDIPSFSFGHGRVYSIPAPVGNGLKPFPTKTRAITLITTYHPSQQNTQTGKLTRPMFHRIFKMVRTKLRD